MTLLRSIDAVAESFRQRLLAEPDVDQIRMPELQTHQTDLQWNNLLLKSSKFRHAHVETLTLKDRISVLHVCIFPHFDDPSPIFGYDIIAGASKVTGIFLDLTGSLDQIPTPRLRDAIVSFGNIKFAQKRELPDWGMIFSPDIIAIRPVSDAELQIATKVALHALGLLLTAPRERDVSLAEEIKAGQRQYADAQRQNQHTLRMLSNIFGKECAVHFIENILFPLR